VPLRRLVWIVSVVAVLLVVAIGASHPTVDGARCPERVWSAALEGLTDRTPEPCAAQALERIYAVGAGLMGLVLISGLLARRD
jgi:hypothetical protein